MPGRERARLLILGGTGEAAALAREAVATYGDRLDVITSLAGRTRMPAPVAGSMRTGGFGGPNGLADYLAGERIDLVVDATHPFAATMSVHAREACETVGAPRLVLERPPWRRHPDDRWIEVDDVAAAAAELARRGGRAFVTVGVQELHHFAGLTDVYCLVRLIEPPPRPLPLVHYAVVSGRGPFTVAEERALFVEHGIDVVVTKASGGASTVAKITAARELGLPVIMVRRPPPPAGEHVHGVAAALAWIGSHLGEPSPPA